MRTSTLPRAWLTFLVLAAFTVTPQAVSAQGFHSVFSRDGDDAWAVGDGGVVYRSLDAGSTWSSSSLGAVALRDVAAVGYRVLVVGDAGSVWKSENSGGAWTATTVSGSPSLRGLAMPSALVVYAVGVGGSIFKSSDGGATWTPQASGVGVALNDVRFLDDLNGWAVGDAGTVLRTVDGGAYWGPVPVGTAQDLYGVDATGSTLWVVGANGAACRSLDGGTSWNPVDLRLDSRADVRAVRLAGGEVWLAGGGGYIRKSSDGGATWTFPVHPLQGQISGLSIVGGHAVACSNRHRVPVYSINGGLNWALPGGATVTRSWGVKFTSTGVAVRGSTFALNNTDQNTIYCGIGANIYRSRDVGENWVSIASIPNCSRMNAFLVSPKDTNDFLVAGVISGVRQVVSSTDHGATWTTTLTRDFGEYGIPLERDPDHPDTVYFGAEFAGLYRSVDGGKNWEEWGFPMSGGSPYSFRSPCDIVVVPDSAAIVLVGDGITSSGNGQYFKSIDSGQTFTLQDTRPSSEIPGMAGSRLRNDVVFGTNWGSGGVQRSQNYGATWPNVHPAGSAWGVDIGDDDPNCMIFGVYSGATSYLSFDGGGSFTTAALPGSNYGFYLRDRETVLAMQSGGIYKMAIGYSYAPVNTQALALTGPDGGETWAAGSSHAITWNSTNVALARVEYRTAPGPWQPILELPGYHHSMTWTVPCTATSGARVRVVDAWDASPDDSSSGDFTISVVRIADEVALDFDVRAAGSVTVLPVTLTNSWSVPLQVNGVLAQGGGPFTPGRTLFTIPAGQSDTVGIAFEPGGMGIYDDTLVVTGADCNVALARIPVRGVGVEAALEVGTPEALSFGVRQNRPNPFHRSTEIEYAVAKASEVRLEVYDLQGHRVATLASGRKQAGKYHVSFGPGVTTSNGGRLGEIMAGVYFYRFRAGTFTTTRKMLFLK